MVNILTLQWEEAEKRRLILFSLDFIRPGISGLECRPIPFDPSSQVRETQPPSLEKTAHCPVPFRYRFRSP